MIDDATEAAIKAHIWALRNPRRNVRKPRQAQDKPSNRWLWTALIACTLAVIYLAVR